MDLHLLLDNLTNPALLFFFLGIIAVQLKSDLKIPENSSKFISLYLLLSIGFKGGQELSHSEFTMEILWSLLFGILLALTVPIYTYYILRKKFSIENSGAIAASYGSVSAVTFITTIAFLEMEQIPFNGHMVAVMALMEAPSIMVGLLLIMISRENKEKSNIPINKVLQHALFNGSVLLIIGSLIIGFFASEAQAEGIKPFTTDIFKGFLAVFLLDMGITSGKKLSIFIKKGWFALIFAVIIPIINGTLVAVLSGHFIEAAMKIAVPKANPSLYIPMALAITFPFNITFGMPLYLCIIQQTL